MKFHVEDPNEPMNEFICQMGELGNYAICSNFLVTSKESLGIRKLNKHVKEALMKLILEQGKNINYYGFSKCEIR